MSCHDCFRENSLQRPAAATAKRVYLCLRLVQQHHGRRADGRHRRVCVRGAAEYEPRSVGAGGHVLLRHEAHHSRYGHRGAGVRDALRNRHHLPRRDVWRTDDAVLVCQLSGRYRAVHHPVLPAQKVSPCLPPRGLHDAAVGAVRHVRVRHRRGRVPVVFGAADAGRHGVAAAGHLRGGIRGVCTAAHRVPEKAGPRPHGRAEGPLYPLRRARGRVRRHGRGQVKKLPILTTPYIESPAADHPPGCFLCMFLSNGCPDRSISLCQSTYLRGYETIQCRRFKEYKRLLARICIREYPCYKKQQSRNQK